MDVVMTFCAGWETYVVGYVGKKKSKNLIFSRRNGKLKIMTKGLKFIFNRLKCLQIFQDSSNRDTIQTRSYVKTAKHPLRSLLIHYDVAKSLRNET